MTPQQVTKVLKRFKPLHKFPNEFYINERGRKFYKLERELEHLLIKDQQSRKYLNQFRRNTSSRTRNPNIYHFTKK